MQDDRVTQQVLNRFLLDNVKYQKGSTISIEKLWDIYDKWCAKQGYKYSRYTRSELINIMKQKYNWKIILVGKTSLGPKKKFWKGVMLI